LKNWLFRSVEDQRPIASPSRSGKQARPTSAAQRTMRAGNW